MNMRLAALCGVIGALLVPAAPAQHFKHTFTIGGGAAVPGQNLSNRFNPTGLLRIGYGYRPIRYLQADTGVDIGFLSAGVKDFYESTFGPLRIRDYEYMVPFGGRFVLPFGEDDRFQVHIGAGGAYLRYSERANQPLSNAGIRLDCPVCGARSGWGTYGLVGGSVALTSSGHFRLGGTSTLYRATTDGQGIAALPAGPSRDRWINTAVELSFTF